MSGRELVAAAIGAARPDWNVIATARKIDATSRPTVIVWPTTITRIEQHGVNWLQTSLEVWVITSTGTPTDKLESALEQLVVQLLEVLEPLHEIAWDTAERGVLDETFHGWKVTVTTVHQIERP